MKKKKTIKREIIEWAIFLGVIGFLFGTGLHTPVFGFIQGLVLKTGIMQPSIDEEDKVAADYGFTLIDTEGQRIPFKEYENKVVFINIWATWCPPCVEEMPSMEKLYQELKDEDFEILAVSIDASGAKTVIPFMKKHKLSFPALNDTKGAIKSLYQTTGVPESFIINKDGIIVEKIIGPRDWASPGAIRFFRNLIQRK